MIALDDLTFTFESEKSFKQRSTSTIAQSFKIPFIHASSEAGFQKVSGVPTLIPYFTELIWMSAAVDVDKVLPVNKLHVDVLRGVLPASFAGQHI